MSTVKNILRISLMFTALLGFATVLPEVIATGKSYLSVWPAFQINSPERLSMRHHQMKLYDDQRRHEFDVTALGGASTNSKELARYFAPFGKQCLKVGELGSEIVKTGEADIIANYFNVFTEAYPVQGEAYLATINKYTFTSNISFAPEYKYYGVGLHYRYHFSCDPEKGFWIDAAAPFMHVETNMHLKEKVIDAGGVGGDNPQVPEGFDMNMGFVIWGCPTQSVAMNLDTSSSFFFHNNQTRSFDLKNNEWSRYMFVYSNKLAPQTSDGINTFTKEVHVGHGFVRNINASVTYTHCNGLQLEGGYQFFSQSAESVEIQNNWKTGPAIAALWDDRDGLFITGTNNQTTAGKSRNNATIRAYEFIGNDRVPGADPDTYDEGYHVIEVCDLDLQSAATPGFLTHTFYASVGRYWDHLYNPKFLGAGFSYEFADENAGMNRWMFWAKIGITF